MTFAFADTQTSTQTPTLFETVMTALDVTGRIPAVPPQTGLPAYFSRDKIADLYLEKHPRGWVANIAFRDVPPGLSNTVGTPDARPFPTEREAFLAGAKLLCALVTGSPELPFFVTGDKLVVVAFG